MSDDTTFDDRIRALASDDPLARRDAARELGEAGGREAIPALIEALRRPSADGDLEAHASRAAAAVALGRIGDPYAAPALLDAISDPFNLGTAASTALGRLRPPPVDALLAATRDGDPWRRARAASALGEIGDPVAFDAIARLLGDEDAVARAAASAFEKLRDPRAVAPLLDVLEDERRSAFVRAYAAMALGALGDRAASPALVAAVASPDALLRRAAARALCRVDIERERDRLARLADDDPDPTVRSVVRRYLDPPPGRRAR